MFDDFWYFTITKLNGGYGATFYRWRCDTRISSNQKVHKINPETQTCPDPDGEDMCWAMKWMFPGTICCPTKKKQHEKQGHTQRNVSRNTEREVDDYIINYPLKILKNYQSFGWFWYPHCRPLSIGGHWGSSSTAYIHLPLSLSCLCVGFRYSECVPVLPPEHQNIIKYHHVRFLQVSSIHHLKVDASICFNSHGLCGFSNSPIFYPHRAGTSFHFGFPFDHRLSRMINGSEIRDGSNSGIPFG